MRPSPTSLCSLAAAALVLHAAPVAAQDYIAGTWSSLNLFFSPSGQPFRAMQGKPYPVVDWFNAADTDHDGKISHDEFIADANRFFDVLDVNHDGYINSPENTRYENVVAPEIQRTDPRITQPQTFVRADDSEMDPNPDENGASSRYIKKIVGASQYGLIDEPQPVRAADANFDFRVSRAEWLSATQQRFAILDRNQDGYITLNELPHTPAQLALEEPVKDSPKKKKHSGIW